MNRAEKRLSRDMISPSVVEDAVWRVSGKAVQLNLGSTY